MTPNQAAARLEALGAKLDRLLVDAERESLNDALNIARSLSSGPYSLAELAEMGHPYAVRDPHPPADPAVINEQSGDFKEDWRAIPGDAVQRLENDNDVADFLKNGTRFMISRPIDERILELLEPFRELRIKAAIREVEK